jgi:hypothetical protein
VAWAIVAGATFSATGSSKTSGTTVATTVGSPSTGVAAAGDVIIVIVAKDNVQTTDGNTSEVTSVADTPGNTYTKLREFCNGQAGAGAGAVVSLWYSVLTAAINVGTTDAITANLSSAVTAKAISASKCTFGAGSTVSTAGVTADLADDAADPGSMSFGTSLGNVEHLFIRATALERPTGLTWTPTTNYTAAGFGAGTTGGSAVTNMESQGEMRVLTGTGDTSDPTATAVDCASVYVALNENAVAAAALPILVMAPPRP